MVDANGNPVSRPINRATIADKVVVINFVADDRNAYDSMGDAIEYLGVGKYHSYNLVPANDTNAYHFWRWREDIEGIKELIRNLSDAGKESLWEWIKNPN